MQLQSTGLYQLSRECSKTSARFLSLTSEAVAHLTSSGVQIAHGKQAFNVKWVSC